MSGRAIHLVEELPSWGASKDQEGTVWLTCQGLPILDLSLTFERAAAASTQQAVNEPLAPIESKGGEG